MIVPSYMPSFASDLHLILTTAKFVNQSRKVRSNKYYKLLQLN